MRNMHSTLLKALGLLLALTTAVAAQDYPVKPLRLLIPFPPGGSVDLVGRIVATKLSERLGRQVVVDNRPGAGGIIATELAANSPPDGYTLLALSMAHAINPWIYKINYDPIRAFAPIASLGNGASVLTVHPSVPANSVKELIALAKSKPGQLHFAHAGVGSFVHTSSVLFAMMAGIDVVQVPFKGGAPAMIDVIGGHSHLLLNSLVASMPHIRSGKLKPLGVSDTQRSDLLPDVPTIAEAGVPGYSAANWWGVAAPAGTPPPVIATLHKEITAVLSSDEVRKRFAAEGAVVVQMSTAEFTKFVETELEKWGKVVKEAKIQAE
jgi:tripartite-type tricarboxylate transporter receptor subunit TctC